MKSFSIFRQHCVKNFKKYLSQVMNAIENLMANEAFAPKEQMLHFP